MSLGACRWEAIFATSDGGILQPTMEALLARRPSQVGVGIEGDSNLPAARARVKELCRRSVIWLEVVAEMRACDNLLQADTPKLSSLEKEWGGLNVDAQTRFRRHSVGAGGPEGGDEDREEADLMLEEVEEAMELCHPYDEGLELWAHPGTFKCRRAGQSLNLSRELL